MKSFAFFFAASLVLPFTLHAQDFAGYRTSNYAGVSSVFSNPASIAGSRYRWDVSLFGVSTAIGNNKASFKLSDIGRSIDGDSIKNKVFSANAGSSSGFASVAFQGPSFFFNLDKKSALAFTTRARAMVNVNDIDGKLVKQVIDDAKDNANLPYTIASSNNMVVNANAWTEFGVSYAREIYAAGPHYVKGGVSLKYLAGATSASINVNNLQGTIALDNARSETYLTNASGRVALNFGGLNTDNFEAGDLLKFKSSGIGADLGFVYEYRPGTAFQSHGGTPYQFRIGLALLDVGSVKYDRDLSRSGAYTAHISQAQRFYFSALTNVDDFKDTLNKYPQYFTPDASAGTSTYTAALPTTLHVDADYHVEKKVFVNLEAQFALTKSRTRQFASQYYNAITLTPRVEGRKFGVYVPLTYHSITKFTAGAAFRLGPLFLGSGSVLSAALGSSKQADLLIGIRFGSLQK